MTEVSLPRPKVSVVITVYNGEDYVAACVASVLDQTYTDFELVIADDSSTDGSLKEVAKFKDDRIRILPSAGARLGLHENWARAYRSATGTYLKHVCHDDLLEPTCLEAQVAMLEENPEAVLAAGRRRIIDDRGQTIAAARGIGKLNKGHTPVLVPGGVIAKACVNTGANLLGEPASVMFRRDQLPEPLFYSNWSYAIDIEFYLRLLGSRLAVLDRGVVSSFRVSPTQLSAVLGKSQAQELGLLFKVLRARHPFQITRGDELLGIGCSYLQAYARRALYVYLRQRSNRVPA